MAGDPRRANKGQYGTSTCLYEVIDEVWVCSIEREQHFRAEQSGESYCQLNGQQIPTSLSTTRYSSITCVIEAFSLQFHFNIAARSRSHGAHCSEAGRAFLFSFQVSSNASKRCYILYKRLRLDSFASGVSGSFSSSTLNSS